jgi:hypothetical protein
MSYTTEPLPGGGAAVISDKKTLVVYTTQRVADQVASVLNRFQSQEVAATPEAKTPARKAPQRRR